MALLMFKASERTTARPSERTMDRDDLIEALAKSAARPLEEAECLNRNNETARSDAVLTQSHLCWQILLAAQMGSINHLSYTLFKRSPVGVSEWKKKEGIMGWKDKKTSCISWYPTGLLDTCKHFTVPTHTLLPQRRDDFRLPVF